MRLENISCQIVRSRTNQSLWDLKVTEFQLCCQQCLKRQKSNLKRKKTVTTHTHMPITLLSFYLISFYLEDKELYVYSLIYYSKKSQLRHLYGEELYVFLSTSCKFCQKSCKCQIRLSINM